MCAGPIQSQKVTYSQLLYEHQLTAGSTNSLLLRELPDFAFKDEMVTFEFYYFIPYCKGANWYLGGCLISPHEEPRRKSSLTTR